MAISSALGTGSATPGVCTSTTRPTSPFEGQMIYETDTNRVLVYDNSAWVMIADTDQPPGLQLIETKDVTTTAILDFTDVFSSDFVGYRLVFNYTQVTTFGNFQFQFRDSGGVIASNYLWNWAGQYEVSGAPTFNSYSYQTTVTNPAFLCSCAIGAKIQASFDIIDPQAANPCAIFGSWTGVQSFSIVAQANITGNVTHNASVTRTGFRLSTAAGTVTGKFSLYGYRA